MPSSLEKPTNCRTAAERFLTVEALLLDFLRQLRQRRLHAVVDVDGVDVGVGAEREADGENVAAVVAAGRLHVQHLVDADDLRFQGLGDARFHHGRRRRRDKSPMTCTCGGTMSGNCATGMRVIASRPASVITIAMTIARRGRSTKTDEIIGRPAGGERAGDVARSCRPRRRGGVAAGPGETTGRLHALQSLDDDQLPLLQPAQIAAEVGVDWPSLTP